MAVQAMAGPILEEVVQEAVMEALEELVERHRWNARDDMYKECGQSTLCGPSRRFFQKVKRRTARQYARERRQTTDML